MTNSRPCGAACPPIPRVLCDAPFTRSSIDLFEIGWPGWAIATAPGGTGVPAGASDPGSAAGSPGAALPPSPPAVPPGAGHSRRTLCGRGASPAAVGRINRENKPPRYAPKPLLRMTRQAEDDDHGASHPLRAPLRVKATFHASAAGRTRRRRRLKCGSSLRRPLPDDVPGQFDHAMTTPVTDHDCHAEEREQPMSFTMLMYSFPPVWLPEHRLALRHLGLADATLQGALRDLVGRGRWGSPCSCRSSVPPSDMRGATELV